MFWNIVDLKFMTTVSYTRGIQIVIVKHRVKISMRSLIYSYL